MENFRFKLALDTFFTALSLHLVLLQKQFQNFGQKLQFNVVYNLNPSFTYIYNQNILFIFN